MDADHGGEHSAHLSDVGAQAHNTALMIRDVNVHYHGSVNIGHAGNANFGHNSGEFVFFSNGDRRMTDQFT
jgi:hypothetical protein